MSRWYAILAWSARLMAAGLSLLLIVFAVGQGFNPSNLTSDEAILTCALFVGFAGMVLMALPPYRHRRRVIAGAIVSLLGIAAFYGIHFQLAKRWPSGYVFPLFFVPGTIQLLCATKSAAARPQEVED